jgi:hypothetical protein
MVIYYQPQIKGDLCRLYSLNGYFGYNRLSETDFYRYCDEYDTLIEGLYSRDMDGFAEGRNITSYIMDKLEHKFTFLIPINNYNNSRDHIDMNYYKKIIPGLTCYFEFNKIHIWVNKKINNEWYKIDSISGVNRIDPILHNKNGKLLVIENKILYIEVEYYLKQIQSFFASKNINYNNPKLILSSTPEILLYNLFHSLKLIKIDTSIGFYDSNYIERLFILKNLQTILKKYMYTLRNNTKKSYLYYRQIVNCFKLIDL